MPQARGKVVKIEVKNVNTKYGNKDKSNITLDNGVTYAVWGISPFVEGEIVEFEYEDSTSTTGVVYHNIKLPKKPGQAPNFAPSATSAKFDELVKILAMPKVHVGITQEVVAEVIKAGSYDKVLTKTYSINLTANPEAIDPVKIAALMDIAEAEISMRIIGMKSIGAKKGSELDTSVDKVMKEQLARKKQDPEGLDDYFEGAEVG
jgi:hypothetical protein